MKNILIGIPIKNGEVFIDNLLEQINKLSYPKQCISICFVENDSDDNTWEYLNKQLHTKLSYNQYKKISLLKLDLGFKLKHEDRHKFEYSKNRIKNLVVLRNFIVNNFLEDNEYLWWVDADVELLPENSIEYLSSFNKDILMPYYYTDWWECYDCASYAYVNNNPIRLNDLVKIFPNEEIIKLERCECASFINRKVFDSRLKYIYVEENYIDLCNNVIPCKLEGVSFSEKAKEMGFDIYGCLKFKIKHWQS